MQTRVTVFVVLAFHCLPGVVDTLAGGVRGFPPRARVLGKCIRVAVEALSVAKLLRFVHGSGAW